MDESGSHEGAPCIAVAACFGEKPEHWKQYERDWADTAKAYQKRPYHATDARPEDNALLASIVARWLSGLAITISYSDFDAVVPHRTRSIYGAEYTTSMRALIHVLAHFSHGRDIPWVKWILEAGHPEQPMVDKLLTESHGKAHIWSHEWVGKNDISTHAADLLAHLAAAARDATNPPLLDLIVANDRVLVRHMSRAELEQSVAHLYERTGWKKQHGPNPPSPKRIAERRLRVGRKFVTKWSKRIWFGYIGKLWR